MEHRLHTVFPVTTLRYLRSHLVSGFVLVSLSSLPGFEETDCHESYNPRKLNAANHVGREVDASLAEPPDENSALVIHLDGSLQRL